MQYLFHDNLEYENAQNIKEKLVLLENYQSKSTVVSQALYQSQNKVGKNAPRFQKQLLNKK